MEGDPQDNKYTEESSDLTIRKIVKILKIVKSLRWGTKTNSRSLRIHAVRALPLGKQTSGTTGCQIGDKSPNSKNSAKQKRLNGHIYLTNTQIYAQHALSIIL